MMPRGMDHSQYPVEMYTSSDVFSALPPEVLENIEITVTHERVESGVMYLGPAEVDNTAVRIHCCFLTITFHFFFRRIPSIAQ